MQQDCSVEEYRKYYGQLLLEQHKQAVKELPHNRMVRGIWDELYTHQKEILTCGSKKISICTPRQVGKTFLIARSLLVFAATNRSPKGYTMYLTDTRGHAKDLVWDELGIILDKYRVPHRANETELKIRLRHNNCIIKLVGADVDREARKLRGYQYRLFVVDEAQSLSDLFLDKLIKEHIHAGLAAFSSPVWLVGTPGEVKSGLFYRATEHPEKHGWVNFKWDQLKNPLFPRWAGKPDWEKEVLKFLAEKTLDYPRGKDDPAFIREYLGKWAVDEERYCYHLSERVNALDPGKDLSNLPKVLGVDIGWHDKTAYIVLAYDPVVGKVYLVEEFQEGKQLVADIIHKVCEFIEKYEFEKIVMDTAGGSIIIVQTLAQELAYRFSKPIEGAEKTKKASYMRLLDSDLCKGNVQLPVDSMTWGQMVSLKKDQKKGIEIVNESCDLCDAFLYAYRDCRHYIEPAIADRKITDPIELDYLAAIGAVEEEETENLMEVLCGA